MKQTITDLWNGNLAPVEHCGSRNPQVNELVCLIEQNRENLNDGLTQVQRETFQKYIDCSEEYLLRMLELAFYDGFCLAGKLAVEMMQ